MYQEMQDRLGEANTLKALGDLDVRGDRLAEARENYEVALSIYREIQNRVGEANTLQALGDLDMREDRLREARANYGEALPIYREILDRLGEAYTLQSLANLDSRTGSFEVAIARFTAAQELHQEVGDRLGLRADWGYLGRHHLRNDAPLDALYASNVSIGTLPYEGDPVGYGISLGGQLDAFAILKDDIGILACLRLLSVYGAESGERFENLMNAIKEQNPDTDYAPLEEALADDPESVRRESVRRVLEGSEEVDTD